MKTERYLLRVPDDTARADRHYEDNEGPLSPTQLEQIRTLAALEALEDEDFEERLF